MTIPETISTTSSSPHLLPPASPTTPLSENSFAITTPTTSRTPSIATIPERAVLALPTRNDMSSDNYRNFAANQTIKAGLTDLLNCQAVRNDDAMRLWVQTRLMETEREMKRQRRKRVSAPIVLVTPIEDKH